MAKKSRKPKQAKDPDLLTLVLSELQQHFKDVRLDPEDGYINLIVLDDEIECTVYPTNMGRIVAQSGGRHFTVVEALQQYCADLRAPGSIEGLIDFLKRSVPKGTPLLIDPTMLMALSAGDVK